MNILKILSQYIGSLYTLLNFIIMLCLIYKSRNYWVTSLKEISFRQWLVLASIISISLWFRFVFFRPRHIMYVDEFWYMEAAKNFITHGHMGLYPKSMGWPVILGMVFWLFGISNLIAIYTSAVLGSLTGINIFLLGSEIYKNRWLGLSAAAIFSIIPGHILWSVTAETNIPSLYFATLSIFFVLLYYRYKTNILLWTSLFSIGFTAQLRPENYLFFLLFLIGIMIFIRPLPSINFKYLTPWFLSISLSITDFVRILRDKMSTDWLIKESGGAIIGPNFGIQNFFYNSAKWGVHLFDNKLHPWFFTLFFILGIIYCFRSYKKYWGFLFAWFILLYIAYFSAWFQTLGGTTQLHGKVRFYISFYPILVIFAVGGIYLLVGPIKNKIFKYAVYSSILLILIFNFLFNINQRKDPFKELQLKVISEISKVTSSRDVILTNLPSVFNATTDIQACLLKDFLENRLFREEVFRLADRVLFLDDYICTISLPNFKENCKKLKTDYDIDPCHKFTTDEYNLSTLGHKYSIELYRVYREKGR